MIRPTFKWHDYEITVGPYDPQNRGWSDTEIVYFVSLNGTELVGGNWPKTVHLIGTVMVSVYDQLRGAMRRE